EAAGTLLGDLLHHRRHDPAGSAPGSPEIDQHRQRALLDHRRIVGLAGFRQPGHLRPADAAMRHATCYRRDSILPPAVRAADYRRLWGHGLQLVTLMARSSSMGVAVTRTAATRSYGASRSCRCVTIITSTPWRRAISISSSTTFSAGSSGWLSNGQEPGFRDRK